MTLVWGIRKKGQADKVRHAKNLFALLNKEEAQIIIPSVVVVEFIIPFKNQKKREEVIAQMRQRFIIAPFDARGAALAAELWWHGRNKRQMRKHGARVCLKADALIIATAKAHGAHVFYTDDDDCFTMASKVMEAKRLPDIPPDLFAYADKS
jgi:predicted nucleic acid-binding protein